LASVEGDSVYKTTFKLIKCTKSIMTVYQKFLLNFLLKETVYPKTTFIDNPSNIGNARENIELLIL